MRNGCMNERGADTTNKGFNAPRCAKRGVTKTSQLLYGVVEHRIPVLIGYRAGLGKYSRKLGCMANLQRCGISLLHPAKQKREIVVTNDLLF